MIFPLAIIFKSGIIKTWKLLWYTNPHISVDRLIFVLSGDRGLLTVCRLAHPEATEVSSESPTCFLRRGFNTNRGSSVPIQHPASLAQLVEQWTLNPWVTGSSPVGGIKLQQ